MPNPGLVSCEDKQGLRGLLSTSTLPGKHTRCKLTDKALSCVIQPSPKRKYQQRKERVRFLFCIMQNRTFPYPVLAFLGKDTVLVTGSCRKVKDLVLGEKLMRNEAFESHLCCSLCLAWTCSQLSVIVLETSVIFKAIFKTRNKPIWITRC